MIFGYNLWQSSKGILGGHKGHKGIDPQPGQNASAKLEARGFVMQCIGLKLQLLCP